MDEGSGQQVQTWGGTYVTGNVYTSGGDFIAGDKVEIRMPQPRQDLQERRNQALLLEKVRKFWIEGVWEKSLHQEVLIELGRESHPEFVAHPWETIVEIPDQKARPMATGEGIGSVFDQTGRALLILGEPGSGKTISLLELADDLIKRAERDPIQPVPVVLNLSTWGQKRHTFVQWVAGELSARYQVPAEMGARWLKSCDLTLLLDGLDEVPSIHRESCVEAINRFGRENGPYRPTDAEQRPHYCHGPP